MDVRGDTRVRRKGAALALLCVAQFVDVLDVNAVIVALHSIGQDLGFSQAGLQWVVSAYVLLFAGFLLLAGRVADLWGRGRTVGGGWSRLTCCGLRASCSWRGGWRTCGAGGGRSSRVWPSSQRLHFLAASR